MSPHPALADGPGLDGGERGERARRSVRGVELARAHDPCPVDAYARVTNCPSEPMAAKALAAKRGKNFARHNLGKEWRHRIPELAERVPLDGVELERIGERVQSCRLTEIDAAVESRVNWSRRHEAAAIESSTSAERAGDPILGEPMKATHGLLFAWSDAGEAGDGLGAMSCSLEA